MYVHCNDNIINKYKHFEFDESQLSIVLRNLETIFHAGFRPLDN